MIFGETEHSLREFIDAKLLKIEIQERLRTALDSLRDGKIYKTSIEITAAWTDEEKAPKLEQADRDILIATTNIAFYKWIAEQCDEYVNSHMERLREIYAETIAHNTASDSHSDHTKAG